MKIKKWAKKARTIVVQLESSSGEDLRGVHPITIRDSRKNVLRRRTLEYRGTRPAMSAIMTDVQAMLARSSLVVDVDSYEFTNGGQTLRAVVSVSGDARRRTK